MVSIRAPQSPAGRRQRTIASGRENYLLFQSAPRSLLRGDSMTSASSASSTVFQSAPRSLLRGDRRGIEPLIGVESFQSAPRSLLRGDCVNSKYQRLQPCFNPRPAVSCGATREFFTDPQGDVVSIRAPQSPAGRRASCVLGCCASAVSIRAPQSPAGRLICDRPSSRRISGVSIRAPQSPAGRRQGAARRARGCSCFNPRPAVSCGATCSHPPDWWVWECFNPRPAVSCGATHDTPLCVLKN